MMVFSYSVLIHAAEKAQVVVVRMKLLVLRSVFLPSASEKRYLDFVESLLALRESHDHASHWKDCRFVFVGYALPSMHDRVKYEIEQIFPGAIKHLFSSNVGKCRVFSWASTTLCNDDEKAVMLYLDHDLRVDMWPSNLDLEHATLETVGALALLQHGDCRHTVGCLALGAFVSRLDTVREWPQTPDMYSADCLAFQTKLKGMSLSVTLCSGMVFHPFEECRDFTKWKLAYLQGNAQREDFYNINWEKET